MQNIQNTRGVCSERWSGRKSLSFWFSFL